MPPGFLLSALVGIVGALAAWLISPRRRGNLGWTMLVGVVGGAASGLALFELGVGALGGAASIFETPDAVAARAYAVGGAIGGGALCLIYQTFRSALYRPKATRIWRFALRPRRAQEAASTVDEEPGS